MARLLAPALEPGCPWSGWTPPNVDWCEEELCAWVVNPAGTWSNLLYIVLGVAMWHLVRTARSRDVVAREEGVLPRGELVRSFGPASIFVGVASLVYHASYTYALQILDFVGMFVFLFTVLSANAWRLGWVTTRRGSRVFFLVGVACFTALVPILFELGVPIQALVGVLIAVAIAEEAVLRRRGREGVRYGAYAAGLALLGAGSVFSLLDVTRIWCDPTNHWLQGHALWHVLTALALLAFFRFYEPIAVRTGPA